MIQKELLEIRNLLKEFFDIKVEKEVREKKRKKKQIFLFKRFFDGIVVVVKGEIE